MASISITLKKNLVWSEAFIDPSIASFQHPLFDTVFSKEIFVDMFRVVLEQLDGTSAADYVDFFFERSPVESSTLVFTGDDERRDFLDWAIEKGCIDEVSARMGESAEEMASREAIKKKIDEDSRTKQRSVADAERAMINANPALRSAKEICNRVTGRDKVITKASKASGIKKDKALAKVNKAQIIIKELVEQFLKEFPDNEELLPEEFITVKQ